MQIEPLVTAPRIATEDLGRRKRDRLVQPRAGGLEQGVEHIAQGEHGRPRIDALIADGGGVHFSPAHRRALEDHDLHAGGGQLDGAGQPADPGADDRHTFRFTAEAHCVARYHVSNSNDNLECLD